MIQITDGAAGGFKKLIEDQQMASGGIRIFTSGGGCCGPSLAMDVVSAAKDGDSTLEIKGIRIFLAKDAGDMLANATIDFTEGQGFNIRGMQRPSCCS